MKWSAPRNLAEPVPSFVVKATGLSTVKDIILKYGSNALFTLDKDGKVTVTVSIKEE